jgi:hypothetical protein
MGLPAGTGTHDIHLQYPSVTCYVLHTCVVEVKKF